MITKRHLVIAVLCTFFLTFTLFTIVPAGSNYKTSGTGEYDPWLDFNEDGYINAKDAIPLGIAFDTFGDPTKNVNVTNWPSWWPSGDVNITNWPSEMNVSVSNWQESALAKEKDWLVYVGQHSLIGPVLAPVNPGMDHSAGQIGPEEVRVVGYGTTIVNFTYCTLGRVNLHIPASREIIGKISLTRSASMMYLQNLTFEFGYTDKNTCTPLASASWAGSEELPTDQIYGFTLELGSLSGDIEIVDKYIYFKVFLTHWNTDIMTYHANFERKDICVMIPQN